MQWRLWESVSRLNLFTTEKLSNLSYNNRSKTLLEKPKQNLIKQSSAAWGRAVEELTAIWGSLMLCSCCVLSWPNHVIRFQLQKKSLWLIFHFGSKQNFFFYKTSQKSWRNTHVQPGCNFISSKVHRLNQHVFLTCGMALFCIFSLSRHPCWQANLHNFVACHSRRWSSLTACNVCGKENFIINEYRCQ